MFSDSAGTLLSCGTPWAPLGAFSTDRGQRAGPWMEPRPASGSWNEGFTGRHRASELAEGAAPERSSVGGAPTHAQVRRASCFVSGSGGTGTWPSAAGRGDCCGHLCFHPPGRSCNVQHFPSLQDRRCLWGESLCLVLTCEALWKVLEKAHWLWMRSAVTRNPGL